MGNCCEVIRAWIPRRSQAGFRRGGGLKYFKTGYAAQHVTVEFENLVEDDDDVSIFVGSERLLTDEEMASLRQGRYNVLVEQQHTLDATLKKELRREEERLRLEDEQQYAAQRAAAQACKKERERTTAENVENSYLGEESDEWALASEEDFDSYLQGVRARSDAFRTQYRLTSAPTPTESGSEAMPTKSSADADSTSLDLEWEDEEGIVHPLEFYKGSCTEDDLYEAATRHGGGSSSSNGDADEGRRRAPEKSRTKAGAVHIGPGATSTSDSSIGLEWENDFVTAELDDNGNKDVEETGLTTNLSFKGGTYTSGCWSKNTLQFRLSLQLCHVH